MLTLALTPAEKRALHAEGMHYVRTVIVPREMAREKGKWIRGKNRDGEWFLGLWLTGTSARDIHWEPYP